MISRMLILALSMVLTMPCFLCSYETALTDQEVQGELESARLNEIFEQYLATVQIYDPEEATRMGLHGSDSKLTSRDPENLSSKLKAFKDFRSKLHKVKKDMLYPNSQIDLELFDHKLEVDIFNMEHLDIFRKRPQYYLVIDAVYELLNKEFAPYTTRAANALSRLELLPQVLLQGEKNLANPPRIWVEQAIVQGQGVISSFSELLPMFRKFTRYNPVVKERVETAVSQAKAAMSRYIDFLKTELMEQASGSFAVGEYAYGFYLERWHGLDNTPRSVYKYARRAFKKTLKEIRKEALVSAPGKVQSESSWKQVLKEVSKDHPERSDLLKVFQQDLERAYDHFDRFKVVPFPRQRLRIRETPAFAASVLPFASYNAPFPLDEKRVSEFYVTLPSEKLSKTVQKKIMQMNFNYPQIEMLIAHEAMPGRHLQNSESVGVSRIRKIVTSPLATNGWACYSEWLALEMGFYSSHWSKLVYLHWKLIRAARALIDVQLHRGKMSYDQALEFLQEEVGLTKAQGRAEILRCSLHPTEGISYIMGMDKILRMRRYYEKVEERHFNLRKFHTRFMKIGNLPIDIIRMELRRQRKEEEKIFHD